MRLTKIISKRARAERNRAWVRDKIARGECVVDGMTVTAEDIDARARRVYGELHGLALESAARSGQ